MGERSKPEKSHQLVVVMLKSHVCPINYHQQMISRANENILNVFFSRFSQKKSYKIVDAVVWSKV